MARGWESKSVEAQQAEAAEASGKVRQRLTAEQIAKLRNKQGLLLSRSCVQQQLRASDNPSRREMLERALAELEARLAKLD